MLIFWTYFLMPMLLHMDVPGPRRWCARSR